MTWVKTANAALVAKLGVLGVAAGREKIALYCVDGAFFATRDACTHGRAQLSSGYLNGYLIECPLHQGLFDVRTGVAAGAPCAEAVQSFPVKLEDGVIHVGIG